MSGKCVYPPNVGNAAGDNTDTPPDEAHEIGGEGFYWRDDSSAYAFADNFRGFVDLVLIEAGAGTRFAPSSVLSLTKERLCTPFGNPNCRPHLDSVKFNGKALREVEALFQGVDIHGSVHYETLPLPLSGFRTVQ